MLTRQKRTGPLLLYCLIPFLALFLLGPGRNITASAQTLPQPTISSSPTATCGDPNLNSANLLVDQPLVGGTLYVKLPPVTADTTVSLYSQQLLGNQNCTLIGSVQTNHSTWAYVGKANISAQASTIIAQGKTLGTEPYEASLDILFVPGSVACLASTSSGCETSYNGHEGTITPTLLSTDTSQVALYTVKAISGVSYTSVNYYDNGFLIYGSPKLMPINQNYLAGGVHLVSTVLQLQNGEQFTINQTINRGSDYTGMLVIRSYAYRHKHVSVLVASILGSVLVVSTIRFVVITLIARRKERSRHFMPGYEPQPKQDEDGNNNIVVGGR